MKLKLKGMSYFHYSLFLATLLSSITLINPLLFSIRDGRGIYYFFYYSTLSYVLLLALAFVVNHKRIILSQKFKTNLFIYFSLFYTLFYITSSIMFFRSGQSIKIHTLLFAYVTKPFIIILIFLILLLFILGLLSLLLKKWIQFKQVETNTLLWVKILFFISIFFLFTLIFYFSSSLEVDTELVKMYINGGEVLIIPEKLGPEKLFNMTSGLDKPNVIFILLESISAEKFSYYGYNRTVTPYMDKLAAKSIVFENTYATSTHSDYAQPAYLSSRYVLNNNLRNMYDNNPPREFIWDIFFREGYVTAYISSQDDFWANMNDYLNYTNLDFLSYSLTDGETDYGSGLAKKDYDHKTMDLILSWFNDTFLACTEYSFNESKNNLTLSGNFSLDNFSFANNPCINYKFNNTRPFFLYTNLQGTHNPQPYPDNYSYYTPDNGFSVESHNNRYDNSLRYVDDQIGRLLEYLDKNDLFNNTVIILTSDHGHDILDQHGINGHGLSVYNDELKVPMIWYFPDQIHQEIKEDVSHIDVLPTVLDILGIEGSPYFQGTPMLKEDRIIFYIQNHKYLVGSIYKGFKTIVDLNRALVEIYDLKTDPTETNNLANSRIHDLQILEILLWHNCQLNYFSVEDKPERLNTVCEGI